MDNIYHFLNNVLLGSYPVVEWEKAEISSNKLTETLVFFLKQMQINLLVPSQLDDDSVIIYYYRVIICYYRVIQLKAGVQEKSACL